MSQLATRLLICRRIIPPQSIQTTTVLIQQRCFTRDSKNQVQENVEKSRVTLLKKYWISRYVDYVKNYEKVLERNFPKAMSVYRVFSIGTKEFYKDLKFYMKVLTKKRKYGIDSLTREELQLTFTMPKDLIKISPVLLLSAVPFTNYVIFPLVFYFPHLLLTSHYWSIQDKVNFMLKEQKRKLKRNKSLFRLLQAQGKLIEDDVLNKRFKTITAKLGSGVHPTVDDILSCKPLFENGPFSLDSMKRSHVRELLLIHGMTRFGFRNRRRLAARGEMIQKIDNAIKREGGPGKLPFDAIRWALFVRGLNPVNMSDGSMTKWLEQWLAISSQVDERSISLLLHAPILLAYNHPTNWTLLYRKH